MSFFKSRKSALQFLNTLVVCALITGFVNAQSGTSSITGTVVDHQGMLFQERQSGLQILQLILPAR